MKELTIIQIEDVNGGVLGLGEVVDVLYETGKSIGNALAHWIHC